MSWKFFIGASIIVGAALVKVGVPLVPIAAGLVTAGIMAAAIFLSIAALVWAARRRY